MSTSQIQSKLRQAQARQRAAIQKYNSEVRAYNNKVRQNQAKVRRAVDDYNRAVRTHNARVRGNQARLRSALNRLSTQTVTVHHASLRQSVTSVTSAYERLDRSDADPFLSDLAERDAANSVAVLNSLLTEEDDAPLPSEELTTTRVSESLSEFSGDLSARWSGAVYALSPENPDAARHFCTSAREIIADMLDDMAPDSEVFLQFPDCETTDRGTPTRRWKVHYCLDRSGVAHSTLESFIDANISDLSVLFKDLNSGAHGPAGKYSLSQLRAIKVRVEDTIEFMCQIAP
ncbi:MAG: hypothetical protein OXH07_09705 [Chloroflexi bacterium]|nr:hypothetical protein [Chloroflexota bacterium]